MADVNDNAMHEQEDYDPTIEPESSKAWLNLIEDAEKSLEDWQRISDNVDKLYADLAKLASITRERQFQLFWANIQVIGPSIYARPPVPVVVTRFRDRSPIPRTTSELLERCAVIMFDAEDIDSVMRLIRDDVTRLARGCAWLQYEDKLVDDKKSEKVCIYHVDRRDWLCSPAREWKEVDWVAKRSWMSADEMEKRFTGDKWKAAAFEVVDRDQQDRGYRDPIKKAGVWEIWCKSENKVIWVTPGVEDVLDSGAPHLKLNGFFPCPRPAYATVQPGSLVPVPDYAYYKDQIEEINELTGRIGALSEALKVKGFYPSGGEIGDVVEAAFKNQDDGAIMVPVKNWAAFGTGGNVIVWLPIEEIAQTITGLVALRKQLIDDVYQITGLSDIMRGQTAASETATAQQLKSQYGSIRVRDRQDELIRIARDITRIMAEIMAENFGQKTLLDMSQMQLPTDADIKKQVRALEEQGKQVIAGAAQQAKKLMAQAQQQPQQPPQAPQDPNAPTPPNPQQQVQEQAQQIQQQAQQQVQGIQAQIQEVGETVTIDQVMHLLREQRLRPFVLDIETDSTIAPDENAQKQRATEFVTAIGGFLNQAMQAIQVMPQSAPLMADTLKYVASQFRAGRELDASIDEFADQMKQVAAQPKPDPNAAANDAAQQQAQIDAQATQQRLAMEQAKVQADIAYKQADAQIKQKQMEGDLAIKTQAAQQEAQIKAATADHQAKMREIETGHNVAQTQLQSEQAQQQHEQQLQLGALNMQLTQAKIQAAHAQIMSKAVAQEAQLSKQITDRSNAGTET